MAKVSVVKNFDVNFAVQRAVDIIGGLKSFVKPDDKVLIKPNLCGGWPDCPGSLTSYNVLHAILELVSKVTDEIVIGEADASYNSADNVFREMELGKLASSYNARIVNLSKDQQVTLNPPHAMVLKSLRVSKTLREADVIIDVPVMKTHPWTKVTLNLKNMFGAMSDEEKSSYHPYLDEVIVDVNSVLRPKLCIIDGIYSIIRGKFHMALWVGDPPLKTDTVIAGADPVATDVIGVQTMGFDPNGIRHIQLASKQQLGTSDIDKIEVVKEFK